MKLTALLIFVAALAAQDQSQDQQSKCARIEGDTIIEFCPNMKIVVARDGKPDDVAFAVTHEMSNYGPANSLKGSSEFSFEPSDGASIVGGKLGDGGSSGTITVPLDGVHHNKVIWTEQQFKDYCGRLDPCEVPTDVEVKEDDTPDADDATAALEARIKKLEELVQQQAMDIQSLRGRLSAVDGKPVFWQ